MNLRPLLPSVQKFDEVALMHHKYLELEHNPTFKDFLYRIHQIRDGYHDNLIHGTCVDKYGKNRDNEVRAVLHALNTILSYPSMLHRQFETSEKNFEKMHARSGNPGRPLDSIAATQWTTNSPFS